MIARYARAPMKALWTEEKRLGIMTEVEVLAAEALARKKIIPHKAARSIRRKASCSPERIRQIEQVTNHDVIAFLTDLSEHIGPDARYLHFGLTSSDVLDTALAVQMKESCDILIADVKRLRVVLRQKARRYKHTVMIGRTHGVHAEPTSFGLKMALCYDEMGRNLHRLEAARVVVGTGKISGAVGTYANIDPFVERYVCAHLGLAPARISTQIIQRDRHAEYLQAMALTAASLEKFSVELRHLQRTEVGEVEEPFAKGQKGSSAMPHKKNPITLERITGLSRVLRANAMAALENVALWHERDISHSSVERVILPDSTTLLDYMLAKFTEVVKGLVVHPAAMARNLALSKGTVFSQRVLLELIRRGVSRLDAYAIMQRAAFRTREEDLSFSESLLKEPVVRRYMTPKTLHALFDMGYHLKHVNRIYKQVGV